MDWLRRRIWPHGIACLIHCPPYHKNVPYTYDEWRNGGFGVR